MEIRSSKMRATRIAPAENFTNPVFLDALVTAEDPSRLNATVVTFTPGARTAWHAHGFRQVLFVTVGCGILQIRGESAQALRPGDVVEISPGIVHWHGASAGSLFTHIALLESKGEGTTWHQHVTDEEYAGQVVP